MRTWPLSGTVVDGLSMSWIAYDPGNLARSREPNIDDILSCRNFDSAKKICPIIYELRTVPAGHYTFGWAVTGWNADGIPFNVARFESVIKQTKCYYGCSNSYQFSGPVNLRPNAPAFSVNAGEVVYVGNVVIDLHEGKLIEWTYDEDMAAARAFVAGGKLAPTMTLRPWTRVDGAPARPATPGP